MIRISCIIDTIGSGAGGTKRQLLRLLNGLNRDRREPHLICLHNSARLARARALRTKRGMQPDDHVFGKVASLRPVKNTVSLIRAAAALKDDYGARKFVVVGGNSEAIRHERTGPLHDATDQEAHEKTIRRVLAASGPTSHMGRPARIEAFRRFSLATCPENHEAFYTRTTKQAA